MAMPDWLYDGDANSAGVFLLVTVIIGGGVAYISGRALAETWRPLWQLPLYMLLLSLAVRFLHYALFQETLLSFKNFVLDTGILMACGALGLARARAQQMRTQYGWLEYQRGPAT
jgi:hypothetical protein